MQETIPPPTSSAAEEHGITATLDRFCQPPYLEEDEDYTRPTQHAYTSAIKRIIQASDLMREAFPEALLTTTEQGGINCYWRKPGFSVRLTIAGTPQGKDYVYVRDNGQSSLSEDVSVVHLAERLQEYNKR